MGLARKIPVLSLLPIIIFVILLGGLIMALSHPRDENDRFVQHINDAAPRTILPGLSLKQNGTSPSFVTDQWRGRVYVVNFFASWCVPCQAEHDNLMQLAHSGLAVIGIAFKDRPEAVRAFIAKNGNPFSLIAADNQGETGVDWGLTGVPETFVVDKNGVIRFHQAGPITETILYQTLLPLGRRLSE